MKKLAFIMPLMTISLLASCGGKTPTPPEPAKYALIATCGYGTVTGNEGNYEANADVALTFKANEGYLLPTSKDEIAFTGIDESAITYSSTSGSLTFKMPANPVSVEVTATRFQCTLTLTLNDCNVEGQSTYSKIYNAGDSIEPIIVTPNESCFLNDNSISIYYKNHWSEGVEGSWILFGLVMDDNYTIDIKGLHYYHASVNETCEHISFTTIDDEPLDNVLAAEDEDFSFKMKVEAELNSEGYKLPTQLSIFIGDGSVELAKDYYTIEEITPQYEAKVTIKGEKIKGDIIISGDGVQEGYYAVDASMCFGVDAEINSEDPPYFYTNEDGTITFTKKDLYELPSAKNIFVKFDDQNWINPSDGSEWCTYDETTHTLTLKANKAKSNVSIIARSPELNLLEDSSWYEINDYSTSGYAPYIFYIGEEKVVNVNNLGHRVRIIGFNHDQIAGASEGAKAGITFEFANLITNSDGKAVTTYWNTKKDPKTHEMNNYNFPGSNLNDLLNDTKLDNCIFKKLPTELQEVIAKVNKLVMIGGSKVSSFTTRLFPLAQREITEESGRTEKEGTTYAFYKGESGDTDSNRIKNAVNSASSAYYWLRSPTLLNAYRAWSIENSGYASCNDDIGREHRAVAPAFCI